MRLIRYTDLTAFTSRAEPFLLAREAEHCLALGILTTLQRGEMSNTIPPYLALAEDDSGRIAEVVVATPPFNLILSHLSPVSEPVADEVIALVADDTRQALPDLPGVHGPVALARMFSERWERLTSQTARVTLEERIYRLSQPPRAPACEGEMRCITEADRSLLRDWLRAFSAEALGKDDGPWLDVQITRRLRFESSGMYVWQVGDAVVSLAGYGGPTPHGVRVGPVYTPPEARGRGYARALTAALSQTLLDEGRQFVFLFTDLANPTSNHIYQQIGYEPVSDVTVYAFGQTH